MARNKSGAPFSLFAFQDAITSVCGVVILITLMLALELTRRVVDDGASAGVDAATFEAAQEEAATLRANIDAVDATLESPEFSEEIAGLSLAEAEERRDSASARLDVARQLSERLDEREAQAKQIDKATDALERENEELAQAKAEAEEAARRASAEAVPQDDGRVYYSFNERASEKPWFVDISDVRIVVYGGNDEPRVFRNTGEFLGWARKRPWATEYFVLIARPSGAGDFETIFEALDAKWKLGVDLVGESQELAFYAENGGKSSEGGGE